MAAEKAQNIGVGTDEEWLTVVEPFSPTFDFKNAGDQLSGVFLSRRLVELPDDNKPGETRMANAYELLAETGKWTVWGGYAIDEAFGPENAPKIHVGEIVRFLYDGKVELDGGRTVRQFTVQVKK